MYFNDFPQIKYDPTGSGTYTTIQDIMTRIKVRDYIKNNASLFAKYSVTTTSTNLPNFLYSNSRPFEVQRRCAISQYVHWSLPYIIISIFTPNYATRSSPRVGLSASIQIDLSSLHIIVLIFSFNSSSMQCP